jgi:DNA-binding MarR family transcriptional regulator
MTEDDRNRSDVDRFLQDKIDTVPHLEALLLLWNSRPRSWSPEDMAGRLFLSGGAAIEILDDLVRKGLIVNSPDIPASYRYECEPRGDELLASVDSIYRRELIRVSRLIHAKPSAAVRAFARAFRLKKDSD